MVKVFLNFFIGVSCVLMTSCSAKISPNSFTGSLESRIVDNHDGTFTDNRNLLQWTKDDLSPGPVTCYGGDEKSYSFSDLHIECLNKRKYLGYNDWRIPTYKELESLLASPEIKNGTILNPEALERLKSHAYWSTVDLAVFIYSGGIMVYNMLGPIYSYHQHSSYYVWPVRSKKNGNQLASSTSN